MSKLRYYTVQVDSSFPLTDIVPFDPALVPEGPAILKSIKEVAPRTSSHWATHGLQVKMRSEAVTTAWDAVYPFYKAINAYLDTLDDWEEMIQLTIYEKKTIASPEERVSRTNF